jgi:hypothetical protein
MLVSFDQKIALTIGLKYRRLSMTKASRECQGLCGERQTNFENDGWIENAALKNRLSGDVH